MTIERIDPPDLFDSSPYGFSQVVVATGGRTVYCAGQVAWDAEKEIGAPDALGEQTRRALVNLERALSAAGGTLRDIVSVRVYIVGEHIRNGAVIRAALVEETTAQGEAQAVGTLSLVYDHHHSDLAQRLTELQHDVHDLIVTTLHIHLDHDNCLEVLVLRGRSAEISGLAQRILAVKGVKHGQLALSAV